MIPKTIHFCWLSSETMPAKMRRCRASWRRHLPGYAYALWDWRRVEACRAESGFDFAWVRHWYERKNYAFAADYLRLWALWREGGIYLDVDVEVLKPFDALLARGLLLGEEGGTGDVEAAVIGAEKGSAAIRAVLDSFGEPTAETLPKRMRRVLVGLPLLPCDYFSARDWRTGRLMVTERTYAVHHFAGSWLSRKERAARWAGQRLGAWAVPVVRWIGHRFET